MGPEHVVLWDWQRLAQACPCQTLDVEKVQKILPARRVRENFHSVFLPSLHISHVLGHGCSSSPFPSECRRYDRKGSAKAMMAYEHEFVLAWLPRIMGLLRHTQARPLPDQTPRQVQAWLHQVMPHVRNARAQGHAINVWEVASLKHDEQRNAGVLAWLLDPRGTHGYGAAVLREVIELLRRRIDLPANVAGYGMLHAAGVLTEHWPMASLRNRVDIAIDGQDFTLLVEVKIHAPEGPDQLTRYVESAQARRRAMGHAWAAVLYLAPRLPERPPAGVACIDWHDIAAILRRLPATGFNGMLVRQFAAHIDSF